jgi:hypothetical protein
LEGKNNKLMGDLLERVGLMEYFYEFCRFLVIHLKGIEKVGKFEANILKGN